MPCWFNLCPNILEWFTHNDQTNYINLALVFLQKSSTANSSIVYLKHIKNRKKSDRLYLSILYLNPWTTSTLASWNIPSCRMFHHWSVVLSGHLVDNRPLLHERHSIERQVKHVNRNTVFSLIISSFYYRRQ